MERRILEFPRPERVKDRLEKLKGLVSEISAHINAEAEETSGLKGLVNRDGTVSMENFSKANGGIYSQEKIQEDLKEDALSELSDSLAFRHPEGSAQRQAAIDEWRKSKERSKSAQIEMAIMVLFHKILRQEFVAVRSAKRDDNANGVDSLIVDKRTGQAICAIDDVHLGEHDRGKAEKTKRIAMKGGAKVEYGLAAQAGKLKRARLENIPVFYLGLTSEQFDSLVSGMDNSANAQPSEQERVLFLEMVQSLQDQRQALAGLELKPGIKRHVDNLQATLLKLRQMAQTSQAAEMYPLAA